MALPERVRKIVHVDMDAFYASVEQRDDPALRGRPVVVGGSAARGVVAAASYEARAFGIHSAMPGMRAKRLCPGAVFVRPDFAKYKAVSAQVREIFARHTALIEPLSLDEAYLDVTDTAAPSATAVAEAVRGEIRAELSLAASAGVAPNKFLAKIASDWNKPDGLFVIKPHHVDAFLPSLPVRKLPGVGQVTASKLGELGIQTCADAQATEQTVLIDRFGRWGARLWELSHGIDERPVRPHRVRKSISSEDTFQEDLRLDQLEPAVREQARRTWTAAERHGCRGRTVVLKLKTADFRILTRTRSLDQPVTTEAELAATALALRERVGLPETQRYRLVGVGLAGLVAAPDREQVGVDVTCASQVDLFSA